MISPLSSEKIERASQLVREMERIENELQSIFNGRYESSAGRKSVVEAEAPKKRKMSPAARARIASAQRARWAKARSAAGKPASSTKTTAKTAGKTGKKKRMMSPEARARIVAAQKKRWAKFRRSK